MAILIPYSLKDLFVYKDKIFISFTEEIKNDCWNTSVIFADVDYVNIQFKKLFSSAKCVQSYNNTDKEFDEDQEFEPHQSGGRMIKFKDSKILLSKVVSMISEKGYEIVNIDSTICLQIPKLLPYISSMKEELSKCMGIGTDDISIKATTTERLGFVGKEKGVSAYATVLINKVGVS